MIWNLFPNDWLGKLNVILFYLSLPSNSITVNFHYYHPQHWSHHKNIAINFGSLRASVENHYVGDVPSRSIEYQILKQFFLFFSCYDNAVVIAVSFGFSCCCVFSINITLFDNFLIYRYLLVAPKWQYKIDFKKQKLSLYLSMASSRKNNNNKQFRADHDLYTFMKYFCIIFYYFEEQQGSHQIWYYFMMLLLSMLVGELWWM